MRCCSDTSYPLPLETSCMPFCRSVNCALCLVFLALAVTGCSSKVTGNTPSERIASINKLADEKPWGAGKAIAAAINSESDPSVREAAISAIVNFPDSSYRSEVEKAAKDPSATVRMAAVRVMTIYKDDRAIDTLLQVMQSDPNSDIRSMACMSMAQIDKPIVAYHLMNLAETGNEPVSQAMALQMLLGMVGVHTEPGAITPQDQALWLSTIEGVKGWPYIQNCYKELNKPLVRHPEHQLKPAGSTH